MQFMQTINGPLQRRDTQGPVQLINIYVMAEGGQVTLGSDSALRKVPELFDDELECMLLGDFNLHHPKRGGERVQHADEAARELIDITAQQGLCLATSQGTTIDLTSLTPGLYNRLLRCTPLDPKEEVEDHTAVETILGGAWVETLAKECWSWKDMDGVQVEEDTQGLFIPRQILSQDSLEGYAQYVMGCHGPKLGDNTESNECHMIPI